MLLHHSEVKKLSPATVSWGLPLHHTMYRASNGGSRLNSVCNSVVLLFLYLMLELQPRRANGWEWDGCRELDNKSKFGETKMMPALVASVMVGIFCRIKTLRLASKCTNLSRAWEKLREYPGEDGAVSDMITASQNTEKSVDSWQCASDKNMSAAPLNSKNICGSSNPEIYKNGDVESLVDPWQSHRAFIQNMLSSSPFPFSVRALFFELFLLIFLPLPSLSS